MPTKWKVLTSLIFAGVVVLAAAIFGLIWFNETAVPWLAARNLSILMVPGTMAALFLVGFVWYRIFIMTMSFLRVDLDD